jgi:hypothetical protein
MVLQSLPVVVLSKAESNGNNCGTQVGGAKAARAHITLSRTLTIDQPQESCF